jgi:branched-chain amino acid transport system ATP-binding protein
MSEQSLLLEVDDLVAGYGPLRVLHGISLSVERGELVTLLGANGAGKTTTLRALSALIKAKGTVRFNGKSILGRSPESILTAGIAHVPQGRGTFPNLSVEENLRIGAATRPKRERTQDVEEWYRFFPRLGERHAQLAGNLSGGEQQMLAVARAMMARPQLLLLDEPSLGLAPNLTASLFERLSAIKQERGTAMLVVEQNVNIALRHADRAYVLESGEISLSGPAADLFNDERVRQAYLRI